MLDLIIKNATIVKMNDDDEIIYDGSVGVKDKNIVIISDQIDQAAGEVIDAKGKIALPGLFNGHTHSYNYIAKGLWDGYALDEPRAYQDLFDH